MNPAPRRTVSCALVDEMDECPVSLKSVEKHLYVRACAGATRGSDIPAVEADTTSTPVIVEEKHGRWI